MDKLTWLGPLERQVKEEHRITLSAWTHDPKGRPMATWEGAAVTGRVVVFDFDVVCRFKVTDEVMREFLAFQDDFGPWSVSGRYGSLYRKHRGKFMEVLPGLISEAERCIDFAYSEAMEWSAREGARRAEAERWRLASLIIGGVILSGGSSKNEHAKRGGKA